MSTKRKIVELDRSPTSVSRGVSIIAAFVAVATSAPFSFMAMPFSFGGLAMVGYGLFVTETRRWLSIGVAGIFAGVLISGSYGTAGELLLLSLIGTIVAWDVGENAISLGEQIGSQTRTRRTEVVHASASALVGVLAGGFGYLAYQVSSSGYPAAALVLLLVGAVVLLWTIRS
ncbi:DUF7519 family protein [Halosimplex pelagicum]|uniref:Uncharacterized protein n=1 Tax=Halosimplex pelagicum TaxID=869886 RepID=A0A7D5P6E5_9EURY|nr:hypothetical protein [Halosimplex pelagicum]QLH82006.1 hypothetical protein HZS54_10410 [Halosimplex pelagicum]